MKTPSVDQKVGAYSFIDILHYYIHLEQAYLLTYYNSALANSANLDIMIRTPSDKDLHIQFSAVCGGDSVMYILEGVTAATSVSELTPLNKYRDSLNTSGALFWSSPTISSTGTTLKTEFIYGGTRNQSVGGAGSSRSEWVFKPGTDYIFRIANVSGGAEKISTNIEYYEIEEED